MFDNCKKNVGSDLIAEDKSMNTDMARHDLFRQMDHLNQGPD